MTVQIWEEREPGPKVVYESKGFSNHSVVNFFMESHLKLYSIHLITRLFLIYLHFKLAGAPRVFECEFRMFLIPLSRGFPGGYLRQAISPVKWHYSHTHMILHIVARDFQNMSQAWTGNKKEGRYLISLWSWGMLKIIVRSEFIWFSMQHFYYVNFSVFLNIPMCRRWIKIELKKINFMKACVYKSLRISKVVSLAHLG